MESITVCQWGGVQVFGSFFIATILMNIHIKMRIPYTNNTHIIWIFHFGHNPHTYIKHTHNICRAHSVVWERCKRCGIMAMVMLNGSVHVNDDNKKKGKKRQQKYFESNVSRDKLLSFILLTLNGYKTSNMYLIVHS